MGVCGAPEPLLCQAMGGVGVETERDLGIPRPFPSRRMAQEEGGSLSQVRARVGTSHGITDLAQKLRFYDRWASDYDQVNPRGPPPPLLAQPQCSHLYTGNR